MSTNVVNRQEIKKALDRMNKCNRLLMEAGLTEKDKQRVIDNPGFRKALVNFWKNNSKKVFSLRVDFDQSFESLIESGAYYRARSLNETPITFEIFGKNITGVKEINLHTLSFDDLNLNHEMPDNLSIRDRIIRAMKKEGFRPPGEIYGGHPLLTFGARYPNEQKKGSIVDLGSSYDGEKYREYLTLSHLNNNRVLTCTEGFTGWNPKVTRFAAIRI